MNEEEGYFPARDGVRIFYRMWRKQSPNACFLIHGYGDYSGRYSELVEALWDLPYSFYAFDLRGQGLSEGKRVYAESVGDYIGDFLDFVRFLKQTSCLSNDRLFLFGHSLGGLIATRVLAGSEENWRGLVLSSPCFELYGISWSKITRGAARILNAVFPALVMSNLVKPKYLFHDLDRMARYLEDPLIERRVTVHLACEIVKSCSDAQKMPFRSPVPVLVMAAGDERIVSLPATERWFEKLEAPRKSLIVYDGFYHEIFNETDRARPISDLRKFLIEHLEDR